MAAVRAGFPSVMQMLRHLRARRRLDRYVDGEARAPDRDLVRRHLRECARCRAVVRFAIGSRQALRRTRIPGLAPEG